MRPLRREALILPPGAPAVRVGMMLAALVVLTLGPARAGLAQVTWTDAAFDEEVLEAPIRLGTFRALAALRSPAVVNIRVRLRGGPRESYVPGINEARAEGSGFLINADGYIVTNAHVVESAVEIVVLLSDGRTFVAELVGSDERTDVALIRIEDASPLPYAPLGDSSRVAPGDWVVAIGNPLGLDHTVTAGIVSALGRRDIRPDGRELYADFIQIDAPINPGNSGGPLLDVSGNVIGMNTVVNVAANSIGFAIPIDMVKALLPQLATGQVERSWLGVRATQVSAAIAEQNGIAYDEGALIEEVIAGSPAAEAGLEAGDIVVRFGDEPIDDFRELVWLASVAGVDREVEVRAIRDGRRERFTIRMGRLPGTADASPPGSGETVDNAQVRGPGFTAGNISPEVAAELGVADGSGVVVLSVAPRSEAARNGLLERDVIVQAGTIEVRGTADLERGLAQRGPGEMLLLRVRRGEALVFVSFFP